MRWRRSGRMDGALSLPFWRGTGCVMAAQWTDGAQAAGRIGWMEPVISVAPARIPIKLLILPD